MDSSGPSHSSEAAGATSPGRKPAAAAEGTPANSDTDISSQVRRAAQQAGQHAIGSGSTAELAAGARKESAADSAAAGKARKAAAAQHDRSAEPSPAPEARQRGPAAAGQLPPRSSSREGSDAPLSLYDSVKMHRREAQAAAPDQASRQGGSAAAPPAAGPSRPTSAVKKKPAARPKAAGDGSSGAKQEGTAAAAGPAKAKKEMSVAAKVLFAVC